MTHPSFPPYLLKINKRTAMNYNIKGLIVNLNDKCKMYSVICPRGEMDPALKRAWVSIHKAENKINALLVTGQVSLKEWPLW